MGNKGNPWRVAKASVTGAAHTRRKARNQDRIESSLGTPVKTDGRSNPTALAVSDGHGGAKYVRSGKGAEFAVLAACRARQTHE